MFDAAEQYQQAGLPLIVLAGKEYGSGSSRDWAAKGPFLLVSGGGTRLASSGKRVVLARLLPRGGSGFPSSGEGSARRTLGP